MPCHVANPSLKCGQPVQPYFADPATAGRKTACGDAMPQICYMKDLLHEIINGGRSQRPLQIDFAAADNLFPLDQDLNLFHLLQFA